MKIAFVCKKKPYDKIDRSGVPYSIFHQLGERCEIFWVKPRVEGFFGVVLFLFQKCLFRLLKFLGKNRLKQTPLSAYIYSKSVEKQLRDKEYDAIFCLDCADFAYLNTDKPIFYRSDAVIHGFINYYVFNVPLWLQFLAKRVEEKALAKCKRFFIPSLWIKDIIIKNKINIDLKKLVLVETGANLSDDFVDYKPHNYELNSELNMLFVGYNIKRKGIDEAFEATKVLNEKYGIKAKLTVMGGKPDDEMLSSGFLCYIGNLNKNLPEEFIKFYKEFSKADLFLFPTKAECHGIVNCEAAAYGLPIFSYQTGGVPSYCLDGYNGRCLPVTSTGADFAEAIFDAMKNKCMIKYSKNSRLFYLTKSNWNRWGNVVYPIICDDISTNRV